MDPNFIHIFLPKQTIASSEEVDALLKKYNISKEQLPKIKVTEPVATALNAIPGDVIKSERHSETTGKTETYYRAVI